MQDASPTGPRVRFTAMRVIIHVHVVALLRVPQRELVDIAREMIVAHHFVQCVSVAIAIVWIQPVGVLEDNRLSSGAANVRIKLSNGLGGR